MSFFNGSHSVSAPCVTFFLSVHMPVPRKSPQTHIRSVCLSSICGLMRALQSSLCPCGRHKVHLEDSEDGEKRLNMNKSMAVQCCHTGLKFHQKCASKRSAAVAVIDIISPSSQQCQVGSSRPRHVLPNGGILSIARASTLGKQRGINRNNDNEEKVQVPHHCLCWNR